MSDHDYPMYTDPNVAEIAETAKPIAFGEFSSWWDRNLLRFERSDSVPWNLNLGKLGPWPWRKRLRIAWRILRHGR